MGLITPSLQFSGDTYTSIVINKIATGTTILDSDNNSLATNQVIKNYIDYGAGSTGGTTSLSTSLSTESSTRLINDNSLSTSISTSNSVRDSEDSSLSSSISTEISTRGSVDSSLSTSMSTEVSTRGNVDSSLSTSVSSEVSNRGSADSSLSTSVSTYISTNNSLRDSADQSLSTAVSTANSVRASADSSLSISISTYISTNNSLRDSADQSLSTAVSTANSTRISADQSLSTDVSTANSVRTSADASLSTAVSTANSVRASADASLSTSIVNLGVTSISGNVDNYLLTAGGGTTIYGESGLQYNGSTLTVNGFITTTSDITAYYSDGRLKTVYGNIDNPLDKITQINGVYYKQNELAEQFGYYNYDRQVGLIAQEVEKILPEVIALAPFDNDSHGNSISGQKYLTIHYDKVVPLLVECIKELKIEIEQLKNKLQ